MASFSTELTLVPSGAHVRHRTAAIAIFMAVALGASTGFAAGDKPPKSPWDWKLFRFEFDNDTFIGSDDAFSAGWSFQVHSRLMDEWNPAYRGWIGKVPGLGDDGQGRRIARWAFGLSQIIITPSDITIAAPQPNDAPWAGTLGVTATWASYDNQKLGAMQIYLGCMGPCSQAEDVQKFIHEDLGFGDPPQGWGNQLSNRALANLNYEYRHKLYVVETAAYAPGRFATDLGVGGQAAVGNLNTRLEGQIEFRVGWGMPMGFTKTPDPPGLGMVVEPVYFDPERPLTALKNWRIYFNLVGRYAWIAYLAPAEGGPTENGTNHPPLESYPGTQLALLGMHFVRVPFGVHVTYYRYFGSQPTGISGNLDWVNFSFEYRF